MASLLISLVNLCTLLLLFLSTLSTAAGFSKVINIIQDNVTVIVGDVLQCEITKTDLEEINNDHYVFTEACTNADICYTYHPVSEKCFSFKVRAPKFPCIILSNAHYYVPNDRPEIILDLDQQYSCIRDTFNFSTVVVSKFDQSGIVNDREYRGFWIRWMDDELLEVGRESETIPFLYHRFLRKLQINYVGIMTWTVRGAWIIDKVPKCPGLGNNGLENQKKRRVESDCMVLK